MILKRINPPHPCKYKYSIGGQEIAARQFRKFLAYAIQNQIEPVETNLDTIWDLGEITESDLLTCQTITQ